MKKFSPILAATTFVIFSASAMAATDTKTIDIEVFQDTYAEITGSAVAGNINNISLDKISGNVPTPLGTLGVTSNGSTCSLAFSTLNDYSLEHETSSALLKKFRLNYLGNAVTSNADEGSNIALDSCVMADSALTFTTVGEMPAVVEQGTYKDTVTITLTAE